MLASQGHKERFVDPRSASRVSPWEHHMRRVALVAILFALVIPARAAVTPEIDPRASLSVVQQWIYNYRAKPDYAHVPAAVRVLFHSQTFKEPERSEEHTSELQSRFDLVCR